MTSGKLFHLQIGYHAKLVALVQTLQLTCKKKDASEFATILVLG